MDVSIDLLPPRTLRIRGVAAPRGYDYSAMTDRSEVVSWACTALATNGNILVRNARATDLRDFLSTYADCGGRFAETSDGIAFSRKGRLRAPGVLTTQPHPGFRTDWQPPLVAALATARGDSIIHETVFARRFGYLDMLERFGVHSELLATHPDLDECPLCKRASKHIAVVKGTKKLRAADVSVEDIRGGFACLIAALVAEGTSMLQHSLYLAKGYERLYEKLVALGADIQVLDCHSPIPADGPKGACNLVQESVQSDAAPPPAVSSGTMDAAPAEPPERAYSKPEYDRLYDAAHAAKKSSHKGTSLEDLAVYVFGCLSHIGKIQRRLNSETGEYDLILENLNNTGYWNFLSGAFAVECKNQATPVKAGDVHKFVAKLEILCLTGGFIFTTTRLSSDALAATRSHRARGMKILAIDRAYLARLRRGEPLQDVIDQVLVAGLFI